jgi:hypothetical protein
VTEYATLAEPPEVVELRANLIEVQERIDRANRQLELAAELEARLRLLLEAPSPPMTLLPSSPERESAELDATRALLQAELRAAAILNASGGPDPVGAGTDPVTVGPGTARALVHHLRELAVVEERLVGLARRALQDEGADVSAGAGHQDDAGSPEGRTRARTKPRSSSQRQQVRSRVKMPPDGPDDATVDG